MLHNIELAKTTPELKEQFEKLFYLEDIPEIPDEWIASFHDLHITSVYDYLSADENKTKKCRIYALVSLLQRWKRSLILSHQSQEKNLCAV